MKRSLKALLLAGVTTGALVAPASPAHAARCVGVDANNPSLIVVGEWECDPCPPPVIWGPGGFHVILCFER